MPGQANALINYLSHYKPKTLKNYADQKFFLDTNTFD